MFIRNKASSRDKHVPRQVWEWKMFVRDRTSNRDRADPRQVWEWKMFVRDRTSSRDRPDPRRAWEWKVFIRNKASSRDRPDPHRKQAKKGSVLPPKEYRIRKPQRKKTNAESRNWARLRSISNPATTNPATTL